MLGKERPKYTTDQIATLTGTSYALVSVLRRLLRNEGIVTGGLKARAEFNVIVAAIIARDLAAIGVPLPATAKAIGLTKGCEAKVMVPITKPEGEDRAVAALVIDYPMAIRAAKRAVLEMGGEQWLPDEHKSVPVPAPEATPEPVE